MFFERAVKASRSGGQSRIVGKPAGRTQKPVDTLVTRSLSFAEAALVVAELALFAAAALIFSFE